MSPLELPTVTLCAIACTNVAATVAALQRCLDVARFSRAVLLTHSAVPEADPRIRTILIEPLKSAEAYSTFMFRELHKYVRTDHVLVVQWDGFILDPAAWQGDFLKFDYIGAIWPQFEAGGQVGNGGFSLRSRRLLEACLHPGFRGSHPEDVSICRDNRTFLEEAHGIRFADGNTARHFAYEREAPIGRTFGFHGVFNIPAALGIEEFWKIYLTLDDRRTIKHDYFALLKSALAGPEGLSRSVRMIQDKWAGLI